MSPELLEIQPSELKFVFESKKQSSCLVQLVNNSDQYIAFKVKTTSPKRYFVRPNTGIIQPKSIFEFTVIMKAQRIAQPDMVCKDKFLIQSTFVPYDTTAENITPSMFIKDKVNYIEENKLRVVLVSPPHSLVLLPINGALKQESDYGTPILNDQVLSGVENLPPPWTMAKDVTMLTPDDHVELLKLGKDMEELKPAKDVAELKLAKDITELKLAKDIVELKSKLNEVESKLSEAEITITKLTEKTTTTTREKETLQQELAILRRKSGVRRIKVGFPLLFVCMVALISFVLGYLLRPRESR